MLLKPSLPDHWGKSRLTGIMEQENTEVSQIVQFHNPGTCSEGLRLPHSFRKSSFKEVG
jgi:hypothetical protein